MLIEYATPAVYFVVGLVPWKEETDVHIITRLIYLFYVLIKKFNLCLHDKSFEAD